MNKTVRNAGIIALVAGALFIPAMRLYKAWAAKKAGAEEDHEDGQHNNVKRFANAYRGENRHHNRKAEANGHHHN